MFERRRRGGLEKGVRRFEGGIVAVSSAEEAAASTVEGSDVSKPQVGDLVNSDACRNEGLLGGTFGWGISGGKWCFSEVIVDLCVSCM